MVKKKTKERKKSSKKEVVYNDVCDILFNEVKTELIAQNKHSALESVIVMLSNFDLSIETFQKKDTDKFEIADKETLRLQFKQMKLDTYIQELFNTFTMDSVFEIVSRLTSRTDLHPDDIKLLEERYNVVFDRNDLEFQLKGNSLKTLDIFVRPSAGDIPLNTCKCEHPPGSESSLYPLSSIFCCCSHICNLTPPSPTSSKNQCVHPPVHQFSKPVDAPSSNLLTISSARQSAGSSSTQSSNKSVRSSATQSSNKPVRTSTTQSSNKPVRPSATQSSNKPVRPSATVSSKTFNNSSLVWSTIQPTAPPILQFSNLSINPPIAPSINSTKNLFVSSLVDSSDEPTDNSLNDPSIGLLHNASNNVSINPSNTTTSSVLSNNLSNNPMKLSSTESGTELEKSVIMVANSSDHFLKESANNLPKSGTDNDMNSLVCEQTNSPNGSLEEQSDHSNNSMKPSSTESGTEHEESVFTSANSLNHSLKQPTNYLQKSGTHNSVKNPFYNSQINLPNGPLGYMLTGSSNSIKDYSDKSYESMVTSFFDSWYTNFTGNQSGNSSDCESDSTKISYISDSE